MLDEFGSDEPQDYLAGFPDHPHRGFETITYMVTGRFRHKDNHGHEGLIETGGAQWMTAGRGIIHSEMPEQKEGRVAGFQLWLNLPRSEKMCEPSYGDMQAADIPTADLGGGVRAKVLAGRVGSVEGPIRGRATEPLFVDVDVPSHGQVTVPVPQGHEAFVYPFVGQGIVGGHPVARGELALLGPGNAVDLHAHEAPVRFLLVAGKPLREPIVQYGPFVMCSREEIERAILDYQAGKF
jgi:redox-sensitive bicupin YhaK (pirin superfamily)